MSETRERKLSQDQVRQIIALHRQGWTQTALAERFGVTPSAINYRLSKHLERRIDTQHCPTCTCHMRGI